LIHKLGTLGNQLSCCVLSMERPLTPSHLIRLIAFICCKIMFFFKLHQSRYRYSIHSYLYNSSFNSGVLNFKDRASYIYDRHTATLQTPHFMYFFQQISVLNFLNMLQNLRFFSLSLSSKCSLFHNTTFFGSCIIHILHTGCDKI
jgi:hypothetical protein